MPASAIAIARCGASWAASTNSCAPCSWARSASCASGHTSPVTLEAPVTASRSMRSWRSAWRGDLEQLVGRGRERQHPQVVLAPGEHVRVVLDRRGEHPGVGRQRVGEDVDGLGGVADEDDAAVRRADEAGDDLARLLVGGGRDLRLRPGPAVDAAVERDEGLDDVPDGGQDRRARRVVEVDVAAWESVGARHLHIGSEEVGRGHEDAHAEILAPAGWGNLG